jgi:folate-binding protein YgfZ
MSDPAPTPALIGPALSPGAIRLSGRDVLTVLHNISTQSLLDLAPGQARLALFCDFRGRLLHRVHAARVSDGSVWLVREDGGGASLAASLERVVFREDVRIEDLSAGLGVTPEFGETPGAAHSGGPNPASGDGSDGLGSVVDHDGAPTRIEIPGCPAFSISDAAGFAALNAARWNQERIERGWAAHGHEVSEAFTPFDVNLGHGVHLDKGCFTGQETLMRLVTYGSLRRRLVRVRGAGAIPETPALRDAAGGDAGTLSSARPSAGGWVALAVVKQAAAPEGGELLAHDSRAVRVERVFPFAQPAGRALRES